MSSYPRLKSGVQALVQSSRSEELFVGLHTHGVRFSSPVIAQIVARFDGRHSVAEIAQGLSIDPDEILQVQAILDEHSLIEITEQTHRAHSQVGVASASIAERTTLERSLITHRSGRNDGGTHELFQRSQFTILISGENRFARTLLGLLQSMGINHTRIITRGSVSDRINSHDLCGLVTRMSDIGKNRAEFHQEIIRESRLPNGLGVAKAMPDLIISTVPVEWDYVQRWMSEGSAHLHINPIAGRDIELGPLVIPGRTPCLRCVALSKRDLGLPVAPHPLRDEMPTYVSSRIAGLVASIVAEYIATGTSPLLGASSWIDLLSPLANDERRYWRVHHECGCVQ